MFRVNSPLCSNYTNDLSGSSHENSHPKLMSFCCLIVGVVHGWRGLGIWFGNFALGYEGGIYNYFFITEEGGRAEGVAKK